MAHTVTLLVREGCGSCVRVRGEVEPLCANESARFEVIDVDAAAEAGDPEPRAEYGDRLPVVLLDGEEYACWEVETDELREDLRSS